MLNLLRFEVKYYFKNLREVIYIYGFFISIILLTPFGFSSAVNSHYQEVAAVILWVALATSVASGGLNLFQRDMDQGRLDYYQMLPIPLEMLVFAKWAGFFLSIAMPLLTAMPILGLLTGLPASSWAHYAIGLTLGAAALTAISSLAAALMAGLERAGALLSLVVIPLTIPVMIFGSYYCREVTAFWHPSLLFLGGFTCFMLPVLCIAGAGSIRAAN